MNFTLGHSELAKVLPALKIGWNPRELDKAQNNPYFQRQMEYRKSQEILGTIITKCKENTVKCCICKYAEKELSADTVDCSEQLIILLWLP